MFTVIDFLVGMERNFISYSHYPVDTLNEPYDYFSIMHYGNKAFSSNGKDTMQSRGNPYLRFGKRRSLSGVDIKQLTRLYRCPTQTNRYRCKKMNSLPKVVGKRLIKQISPPSGVSCIKILYFYRTLFLQF